MALINCPNCGCKVSDKADACPKCGTPISDCSESLEKEIVPPVLSVENQSEENEEQKFYKSILHLIELENYEDAFVGIDALLAQSDHPDQYVGLKESVVEKWVKKLIGDADRCLAHNDVNKAQEVISQALMLKPNDAVLLNRIETIQRFHKKNYSVLIVVSIVAVALLVIGGVGYYYMIGNNSNSQSNHTFSQITSSEEEFTTPDLTLYDLRGHVKSVTYSRGNINMYSYLLPERLTYKKNGMLEEIILDEQSNIKFSSDGNSLIWSERNYLVERDGNGRMLTWKPTSVDESWPEEGIMTFFYDKKGKASAIRQVTDGGNPDMNAKYNDDGTLKELSMSGYTEDNWDFEYVEFDKYSNWTKRIVHYYYGAVYDGEEDIDERCEEVRSISYYDVR